MLKPYMVFSSGAGCGEGAGLVFAHTAQEARKVGWRVHAGDFTDEWIDFTANRLGGTWLYEEADPIKMAADIAHVVIDMKYCLRCEKWGHSPIDANNLCESCCAEEEHEKSQK